MKRVIQFLRTSKGRYLLLSLAACLITWGFLRGCSSPHMFSHPRYNIAVDRSWYPLALYGKERNLLAFTDDLLDALAVESGLQFNLHEVGTPNLIQDLDSRLYDGIISSLPPTSQNVYRYQFSDLLYAIGPVLVVKDDSKIESLAELNNHSIGISRGISLNFDTPFPGARIVPYDNMSVALSDLEDGIIDAAIMDSMQAYLQIQGIYTGRIKIVTRPLTSEGVRLVVLNNVQTKELMEIFNKSLLKLKDDGKYEELLNRWGLFNPFIKNSVKV